MPDQSQRPFGGPRVTLSPPEEQALANASALTPFWKGQEIGRQGDPCGEIQVIRSGQVLLSRRAADGKKHALYLLGPHDLFGEGALTATGRWLSTVRAVEPGETYVLPVARISALARHHPELVARLFSMLAERLERAHDRVGLTTSDSARARLLGLLYALAERSGEQHDGELWLPISLSQAELGEMVGLARETVARLLADLETEGTLRKQPRSGVWLRTPASLPKGGE